VTFLCGKLSMKTVRESGSAGPFRKERQQLQIFLCQLVNCGRATLLDAARTRLLGHITENLTLRTSPRTSLYNFLSERLMI
jgi:hypothetical protein